MDNGNSAPLGPPPPPGSPGPASRPAVPPANTTGNEYSRVTFDYPLTHRTTPASVAGILENGPNSSRGFIWFADPHTKDFGMGKERLAQSTGEIIFELNMNVESVPRINHILDQVSVAVRALMESSHSHISHKMADGSINPEWAAVCTRIKFDLLHLELKNLQGDVFQLKTRGGLHFAVRESANTSTGRVVDANAYILAKTDLYNSPASSRFPFRWLSIRTNKLLSKGTPDAALHGIFVAASTMHCLSRGNATTSIELEPDLATSAVLSLPLSMSPYLIWEFKEGGLVPMANGMNTHSELWRESQRDYLHVAELAQRHHDHGIGIHVINKARSYMAALVDELHLRGAPGLTREHRLAFDAEHTGTSG